MTQRWPLVQLRDLGTWFGGGTPSKSNSDFWSDGTVPWLSPKDMGRQVLTSTQDRITEQAVRNSSVKVIPAGSVAMVVRSGILERTMPVAVVPFDTTLNQDMKALVPHQHVDARWVAWGLKAAEHELLRTCRKAGTTVASIEMTRLLAHRLPLPPLVEQRRIVDILEDHLSRLDAGGLYLSECERKLRSLRVSCLVDAVTAPTAERVAVMHFGDAQLPIAGHWLKSSVGESSMLIQYGTSAKAYETSDGSDVPVLRMGNVKEGRLDGSSLKFLNRSHTDFPALLLQLGDLLFNRTNSAEHVGKSAVFSGDPVGASFASYLIRVRFSPQVDSRWANMVINSPYGRAFVASVTSQQVGQANVNGTKLKRFPLPVPPMVEQQSRIGTFDQAIGHDDRLRATLVNAGQRLALLRRTLLTAAFSGRLAGRSGVVAATAEELADI